MSNSCLSHNKFNTIKYIVEKVFCHHDLKIISQVNIKDESINIIGVNILLVCDKCGRTKIRRI